jgi:large subunit ribosomal protein L6
MSCFSKRVGIKIPRYIEVFYNQKKNLLLLIGPFGSKLLLPDFKLILLRLACYIFVITSSLGDIQKKYYKSHCGSFLAELKLAILELSVKYFVVLRLFGVGFKSHVLSVGINNILQFKLGFSHLIFYKIPENINLVSLKNTKIFLSNPCLKKVTQASAFVRSFKLPDPYKGKGILYNNEKVRLKKGKKVS